jgi:PAS domain S-box-containing protein
MSITQLSVRQRNLLFGAAMALIVLLSAASLLSTQRLFELSARAERSQNVLTELNHFFSNLQDVEGGARGYLITGDPAHLEPYVAGKAQMPATVARLRALAAPAPSTILRLDVLEQLGSRRIAYSDRIVSGRTPSTEARGASRVIAEGKAIMDRLRREVSTAMAAERADYIDKKAKVERQARLTNAILAAGMTLSLAALFWLFITRNREAAQRLKVKAQLRELNAELEDRIQQRTAELGRTTELLNAVIENMPDSVFLKDIHDQFRYVLINGAGERLFGRERTDLLGHIDHELFPREQADLCKKEDEAIVTSGQALLIPERALAVGETEKVVESRKVAITDPDGRHRFVLGIVRDITEQKAVETQLRQMQRMDAIGRLTGGIAHDFNNILAIILGNVDLLREQVADGSQAAEMADEALAAASHGAELVRRLLAFARKQHLEPTAVDLNERLPATIALLRRTLGENIDVRAFPAPDLWSALVDPTQVDDALVNLAINARDAMAGGGALTIETGNVTLDSDYAAQHVEVSEGDYVMLAVSDTGTGMSPAVVARAFEPFFTTKSEGKGTGLGLSQVYGWVKQSGGHIKIYSEVGHGTTIKLYLPRAGASHQAASDAVAALSPPGTGSERILVVEDNPNVRNTVLRQLKDLGYETVDANDGETALGLVRDGTRFDLLLTDVVMPGGMTGYELADEISRLRPDLKVLFTSGYTELASGNGNGRNARPLLSKPYRKQDLGRAIRRILDGAE